MWFLFYKVYLIWYKDHYSQSPPAQCSIFLLHTLPVRVTGAVIHKNIPMTRFPYQTHTMPGVTGLDDLTNVNMRRGPRLGTLLHHVARHTNLVSWTVHIPCLKRIHCC